MAGNEAGSFAARLRLAAIAGVLAVSVCACSSDEEFSSHDFVDNVEPADVLYNQALANMDAKDLKEARVKFQEIDRQHPYSEYSRKSLLMVAFTSYRMGDYGEATNAGNRYVQLYPGSDDAAYAQYLVGMSHFRRISDVTRDQGSARKAMRSFTKLIANYPESEYVADASTKIRGARDQLSGKEMLVGRYYQERREFLAAINRFRLVVESYSNTRHVEEALARLTESYYALGLVGEAQAAAAVLGHNFPDSQWYKETYELLANNGIRPEQQPNSWFSRLTFGSTSQPS